MLSYLLIRFFYLEVTIAAEVALGASAASLVARSARRASASQSGAMAMGRCTMSCDMPRSSSETRAHRMYCCGMHTMWSRASSRFSTRAGLSPRGVEGDDGTPLYIYIHPPIHHPSICPHVHVTCACACADAI